MITPLLALLLLAQAPPQLSLKQALRDFPRSELQIKGTGPISIDLNQSARASYQALADLAGVGIMFDRDFRDSFFEPFHVNKGDLLETFDTLSALTGNFVDVLDSKTIVVAANNATKHREYEPQVVQTFYLAAAPAQQDVDAAITALRMKNMRNLAKNTDMKAVVVRDAPDRVAGAEKLLAELYRITSSEPIAIDAGGNILTHDGGQLNKSSANRSEVQAQVAGPISIHMNEDARDTYEALAARGGLNVIFDPDFKDSGPVSLKLDNTDFFDALDLVSRQTGTFWEALNPTTILVSIDNQTKRRDYSSMVMKTIYLDDSSTQKQIVEIITSLRSVLNMRYLAQVPAANAIALRDTPTQISLAEKIIADLVKIKTAQASDKGDVGVAVGSESGGLLKNRAARTLFPAQPLFAPNVIQAVSLDVSASSKAAFEELAGKAGLHITFDKRFRDSTMSRFTAHDVSLPDALDFLSLETRSFWRTIDGSTILIAPDTQTVRRDLDSTIQKIIPLNNVQSPVGILEIVTAARTLLNIRQIEGNPKGIVLNDTADNVGLVEKLVATLDRPR